MENPIKLLLNSFALFFFSPVPNLLLEPRAGIFLKEPLPVVALVLAEASPGSSAWDWPGLQSSPGFASALGWFSNFYFLSEHLKNQFWISSAAGTFLERGKMSDKGSWSEPPWQELGLCPPGAHAEIWGSSGLPSPADPALHIG